MKLIDADELLKLVDPDEYYHSNEVRDMIGLVPTIEFPPNDQRTLEELREIIKQLEWCGYECEGGPLSMNKAFIRLKELAYRRKPYPNPPLTLEQLRGMEGEPVWIYNAYNGWYRCCVIELVTQEDVFFTDGTARRTDAYEDGWLAYRRKPEEAVS